jgi:hypothetical protein
MVFFESPAGIERNPSETIQKVEFINGTQILDSLDAARRSRTQFTMVDSRALPGTSW